MLFKCQNNYSKHLITDGQTDEINSISLSMLSHAFFNYQYNYFFSLNGDNYISRGMNTLSGKSKLFLSVREKESSQ